nr:retrovirus-related Pol polyprotein from transposon TNT 1-94 [Tanacetum cinerariifolium]
VLTQSKLVPINVVRPVSTTVLKISVTRPRQAKTIVTKTNSPPRMHINCSPSQKASTSPPRVTVVKAPMVNVAKGNPQHALKDKGVIDSRCSRHMTGNMSYLSDFEELNGGYVAFGGKFDGKVDEGFLVGYSVSSKAFRVFNSRTRIIQETLHVNFLENKPNVAEKAREEYEQQYVLFPVWSSGSTNPQNTDGDAAFDEKEPEFEGKKPDAEFEDFSNNIINEDNAAGTLVHAVGQLPPDNTNIFSVAGPSNATASPTHGKYSRIDTS